MAFFSRALVLVRGGGDLGSGVTYRLHRAGFPVVVTERARPLLVRRAVSYGDAVFSGDITIGGLTAARAESAALAARMCATHVIPVLVDEDDSAIGVLRPVVVVDARMQKVNLGTRLDDAPLVVALGPGFSAGLDCHVVIETNRGHDLGRVIEQGPAEADTGEPGSVGGKTHSRVLRAPADGHVQPLAQIGDTIEAGQTIATVSGEPIVAAFGGVLRGLIHEQVAVVAGMKVGDLDPRAKREHCFSISDKSLAIGGGVLEAVLAAPQVRTFLQAGV